MNVTFLTDEEVSRVELVLVAGGKMVLKLITGSDGETVSRMVLASWYGATKKF